ncbi:AraC family transcriptional regulator [Paenibacillus oenotherae]|uniref:AraC family transcriptional regulator n=1 Tax=Paenibacillus oenotherae TaxID=1435645 RepID=A0ABS7D1A2_9BACL|nr:AraC family transcriptional regulator [Paenibacillus oenotherae]MBW7473719.1 AraC family transcriptional regulator [Paenibacillus oenotherae]
MNKAVLKEDRIHGTPLYPISYYEISCPPGEPLLELHWHEELEFLMVTEGRAVFRVDMADYEVQAGEAIFVNTGELHSGYIAGDQPCSFKAIVFHPDLIISGSYDVTQEKYVAPLIQKRLSVPSHLTTGSDIENELLGDLRRIIELNESKEPAFELATKGLLLMAIAKLTVLGEPRMGASSSPAEYHRIARLKTVLNYVQAHYSDPIRLKELAALVSMSEAHFCRLFKEITTKTPIAYINQYRVQQAALLLTTTDKKMMEIALDVGFSNSSYFIGIFKQYYGCTPSFYRSRER